VRHDLPSRGGVAPLPLSRRVAAATAIFLVLALVGCSGIPAPTVCYQITAATVHGVDTGMNVAGDLYRAGKLSEDAKAKLVAAHNVYRPTAQAAVAGCKVVQNQGDIDKVVANLKTASDKLLEALVAAGVLR
jgi:hypothetical protein